MRLEVKIKKAKGYLTALVSLGLCVATVSTGFAQSGGTFSITKSVIAGGGGRASGGTFTLEGTIGQPFAGTQSTGTNFSIIAGFWGGGAAAPALPGLAA